MPLPDSQWIPTVGGGDDGPTPPADQVVQAPEAPALPTRPAPSSFPPQLAPVDGGLARLAGLPVGGGLMPSFAPGAGPQDPLLIYPGLPAPLTPPEDKTFSVDTTLTVPVAYYKNLTINAGVTVTGLAGGTIIIVQETFTLNGVLSANGLGAAGGAANNNPGSGAALRATDPPELYLYMPRSGVPAAGAVGGAATAWPLATATLTDLQILILGIGYVLDGGRIPGTAGVGSGFGAAGGGGGGGGCANAASSDADGAHDMGNGGDTSTRSGGSGVGSGGAGGDGTGVTAGAGGTGGGVSLVYCSVLSGSGSMTCNGTNGANGATNGGGGGGGGGGFACIAYHTTSNDSTTVSANGGTGGTAGGGTGFAGGNGSAGAAFKLQMSVA